MAALDAATHFDICTLSPKREVVEDAAAALAMVETLGAELRSIKLSNKSYRKAAAEALAGRLEQLRGVVDVDVSDVIAGRPEDEALEVLAALATSLAKASGGGDAAKSAVTALDVSDNALGQKGIDALIPLFRGAAPLKKLKTCNNGMSEAAARQLASILAPGGEKTSLEVFHYFNNMSGDNGAMAVSAVVAASPALVDLRFSGTRTGRVGSLAFAAALRPRTLIHTIDLADNTFGADGGAELGAWLAATVKAETPLRTLILRDCALGDEGFAPIAEHLGFCTSLKTLDVSGNELTAASCEAEWLPGVAASLEVLGFEENEIGSLGGARLASALSNAKLPKLTKALFATDELASKGALLLAKALVGAAPALATLELNGNALSDEALEKLGELLPDGVLGEMDDNDEDLADDDELDDAGDDGGLGDLLAGIGI